LGAPALVESNASARRATAKIAEPCSAGQPGPALSEAEGAAVPTRFISGLAKIVAEMIPDSAHASTPPLDAEPALPTSCVRVENAGIAGACKKLNGMAKSATEKAHVGTAASAVLPGKARAWDQSGSMDGKDLAELRSTGPAGGGMSRHISKKIMTSAGFNAGRRNTRYLALPPLARVTWVTWGILVALGRRWRRTFSLLRGRSRSRFMLRLRRTRRALGMRLVLRADVLRTR
jgi:hypothetical protein